MSWNMNLKELAELVDSHGGIDYLITQVDPKYIVDPDNVADAARVQYLVNQIKDKYKELSEIVWRHHDPTYSLWDEPENWIELEGDMDDEC